MLLNNPELDLFTDDKLNETENSTESTTKKSTTKSKTTRRKNKAVDDNVSEDKLVDSASAKVSKPEEQVLKTKLDFDMLSNIPLASAKNFVNNNKVVDSQGVVTYKNREVSQNKVLESIKKSASQQNIDDLADDNIPVAPRRNKSTFAPAENNSLSSPTTSSISEENSFSNNNSNNNFDTSLNNNLNESNEVEDEYTNSLYGIDNMPYAGYTDNYNQNGVLDSYDRPKDDNPNGCYVLTNGNIRPVEPVPNYVAPYVDYSQGEEFEKRKNQILAHMDDYGRLSNFEVDLYTTYPYLLPSTDNELRKNTVQYCKALHELKFEFLFFDTETTGMNTANSGSKAEGHRIITLGMVPYFDGKLYDEDSQYCVDISFDPEQEIDLEASKVHGIYNSDLVNSGKFADFIPYFKEVVQGKVLCAHNAAFDVDFINHELDLANAGWHLEDVCLVIDSLAIARTISSGRASLDALSKRYNINIERTFHGALLDSIILGHVYLAMLNSYQNSIFGNGSTNEFANPLNIVAMPNFDYEKEYQMANNLVINLTDEELELHNKFISGFSDQDKFIEEVNQEEDSDDLDELDEDNL